MGTNLLLHLQPSSSLIVNPNENPRNKSLGFSHIVRIQSTRFRATGFPGRDAGRFSFNIEDELYADEDDLESEFRYSNGARKRIWWSNDDEDDDINGSDVWEFDENDEFWFFKVFRAFGWMLPAIAISLVLGTGPNAFLMALVAPLGQTVLSLAFDKVWGSNGPKTPKPNARTRKRPFTRSSTASQTRKTERREDNVSGKGRDTYNSWEAANVGSHEKGDIGIPRFGGWDELDEAKATQNRRKDPSSQKVSKRRKQQKVKFSRIGRVRDKPLFLRLLIAVFPFLGSWTKLLF